MRSEVVRTTFALILSFFHSHIPVTSCTFVLLTLLVLLMLLVLRGAGHTKTLFLYALIPSFSELVGTFFALRVDLGTKLSFLNATHSACSSHATCTRRWWGHFLPFQRDLTLFKSSNRLYKIRVQSLK